MKAPSTIALTGNPAFIGGDCQRRGYQASAFEKEYPNQDNKEQIETTSPQKIITDSSEKKLGQAASQQEDFSSFFYANEEEDESNQKSVRSKANYSRDCQVSKP